MNKVTTDNNEDVEMLFIGMSNFISKMKYQANGSSQSEGRSKKEQFRNNDRK